MASNSISSPPNTQETISSNDQSPVDKKKSFLSHFGAVIHTEPTEQKQIHYSDLFGKFPPLTKQPLKNGVRAAKIESYDQGHIPGRVKHWDQEIEQQIQDIRDWTHRSVFQKISYFFARTHPSDIIIGKEILQYHPTREAKKCVVQLKKNAQDVESRLQLIRIVGQSGRTFTDKNGESIDAEVFRALFLQTVVACSLNKLNTQWLELALWAQDVYCQKLMLKCKSDLEKIDEFLINHKLDKKARKEIATHIEKIKLNFKLIKSFHENTTRKKEEVSFAFHCECDVEKFMEVLVDGQGNENTEHALQNTNGKSLKATLTQLTFIISLVRYLPLMHKPMHQLLDVLGKLDSDNPIPFFLKARMHMSTLILAKGQFEVGDRDTKTMTLIQSTFQDTYDNYRLATQKVGTFPKTKNEFTILIEYANVVYFIYKLAKNTLQIELPQSWLKTACKKAVHVLEQLADSDQAIHLKQEILKIMEDEALSEEEVPTDHQTKENANITSSNKSEKQ